MIHGDAFNDMPKEYREYRENTITVEDEDSLGASFDHARAIGRELSEVDKAITDGKPRWIHHENSGWKWVFIDDKGLGQQGRYLSIRDVPGNAHDYSISEAFVTEILPYGETPPPAVPEKPLGMNLNPKDFLNPESYMPDAIPSLNRCPDCDNTLEQRSMPDGIEEWCTECNVKAGRVDNRITELIETAAKVCDYAIEPGAMSDTIKRLASILRSMGKLNSQKREREPTEAEGPMHPDMIRAELQKAMDEGYKIRAMLKPEFYIYHTAYKLMPPHTTNHVGDVQELTADMVDIYPSRIKINKLQSVRRVENSIGE